jgi:hypothetical protein
MRTAIVVICSVVSTCPGAALLSGANETMNPAGHKGSCVAVVAP